MSLLHPKWVLTSHIMSSLENTRKDILDNIFGMMLFFFHNYWPWKITKIFWICYFMTSDHFVQDIYLLLEIQQWLTKFISFFPSTSIIFSSLHINGLVSNKFLFESELCWHQKYLQIFLTCYEASCQFVPSKFVHMQNSKCCFWLKQDAKITP